MLPSDPCPWCGGPETHVEDGASWPCCQQSQDAERACEMLEASDRTDDESMARAAVTYWPELAADLPVIRQKMTHERLFSGEVAHG